MRKLLPIIFLAVMFLACWIVTGGRGDAAASGQYVVLDNDTLLQIERNRIDIKVLTYYLLELKQKGLIPAPGFMVNPNGDIITPKPE